MVTVPTLENTLYLQDPEAIIGYGLRRYARTPANTIPFLSSQIISLPQRFAEHGGNPDDFCTAIQTDLMGMYQRIFSTATSVVVYVTNEQTDGTTYTVDISVQVTINGQLYQLSTNLPIVNGEISLPQDVISYPTSSS